MTMLTSCPSHADQRLCPVGHCRICDRQLARLAPVTPQEAVAAGRFYAVYYLDSDLVLRWFLPRQFTLGQCVKPFFMALAAVECGTPKIKQMEMTL